jgi:pimeloyl-ACP methyl ester carboxylesterase
MHVLGARYPTRIAGLVYVDAAFDRGDDADSEAYDSVRRTLPGTTGPRRGDLASFTALRSFFANVQGLPFPEAYLRTRLGRESRRKRRAHVGAGPPDHSGDVERAAGRVQAVPARTYSCARPCRLCGSDLGR